MTQIGATLLASLPTSMAGRTFDVQTLNVDTSAATGSFQTAILGLKDILVTGVQKAIQRWLSVFLTTQGTVQGDPNLGSLFMLSVRNSASAGASALASVFNSASFTVTSYLKSNAPAAALPDEIIKSVTLASYSMEGTTLNMTLKFTTQSGTTVVPVGPLNYAIS